MSPGLIIFLIIVMWLFVLAPLLLRGQRPIRRSGQAYEDTRVVYEGGSGELPVKKASRMGSTSRKALLEQEEDDDLEVLSAEEVDEDVVLIDEQPQEVVDGDIVEPEDAADEGDEDVDKHVDIEHLRGGTYEVDESFTDTADLLHPYARAQAAATYVPADEAEPAEDESLEMTEDDVEFARARSQRGGWDPDREEARNADIYARRRRTLIGLGAAVVLTLLLGIFVGGWTWWLTGVAVVLLAAYLFALRAQVIEEKRLRERRIRQLRRARMGVRQSDAPANLRRPGGVVMELDDESPDFDGLDTITPEWDSDLFYDTDPDYRDVS